MIGLIRPIFLLSLLLSLLKPAFAEEPRHIKQSIRALGMGNAFVAAANDENALFYNPAGLSAVQNTTFELLTTNVTVNNNLIEAGQSDSDSDDETVAAGYVGKKFYVESNNTVASMTGPGWGYSLFGSFVIDAAVHNPVVPYFDVTAYIQYGAMAGFSMSFLDHALDIGIALKTISRQGISKTLHITDFASDETQDELEDEIEEDAKEITVTSPDIGFTYHFDQIYNMETRAAFVVRNIGGMDFKATGNIPMSYDVGLAAESEILGIDFLMAADFIDLSFATTEETSPERNLKLGLELGFFKRTNNHHALSLRVGRNGPYLSSGATLNIPYFPLTIDYAAWSEEIGTVAGQIEDKRQAIQISFNF